MAQLVKTMAGLAIASVKTVNGLAIASAKTVAGLDNTSGGGLNTFTDDFTRANGALGANWDVDTGSITIVSNAASVQTGGYAKALAVYIGGSLNTIKQAWYGQLEFVDGSGKYPHAVLRYTNDVSPYYSVEFAVNENNVTWYQYPSAASGSSTAISAATAVTGGIDPSDFFGITVEGTGSGTVVRVWLNPGAPFNTVTDTVSSWNGSGPLITWNDDPGGVAVDSGPTCGMQCFVQNAGDLAFGTFQMSDAA